jgi:hypothetical protein
MAIFHKEIMTGRVIDPCTGTGILARAAMAYGYETFAADIHNWGYAATYMHDWLNPDDYMMDIVEGQTVFMNPPFSKACAFVDTAFRLKARKVVCFQRFAWYEGSETKGSKRGAWWRKNRPARIWLCGDRATCWLHSIPAEKRTGSATPTPHAFFVWEQGHAPAALCGQIYKSPADRGQLL